MKALVVSDTHQNAEAIRNIVEFAKANDITTVLDAGDLHGAINSYEGVNLHAVHWDKASGGMGRWDFNHEVGSISGTVHNNGSAFKLEDMLVFMQHNLADYLAEIPPERLEIANNQLDSLTQEQENTSEALKRFILFGHTHKIHYNNDGESIAINPGYADGDGTFAVLDSQDGTIEFRTSKRLLFRVDETSDFVQVRGFNVDSGDRILRLKNFREVFQYHEDDETKRTEEFAKIHLAFNSAHGLTLKVEDEDSQQQLIIGNFRSKKFKRIGKFETNYDDKSPDYGKLQYYIGTKEIECRELEVFVAREEEEESICFDKIKTDRTPIIDDNIIFVGQTRIGERHKDPEDDKYIEHVVVNNEVKITYRSIEDILSRDGRVIVTARDENGKSLVSVINEDGSIFEGGLYESVSDANYKDKKLINGKIVYVAKDSGEMFVVIDGVAQTRHKINPRSWKENLREVQFIGDKLSYIVEREESYSIFFNGQEKGSVSKDKSSYENVISNLIDFNGKPAYLAKPQNSLPRIMVDDSVAVEAEGITYFSVIGGKLVYQTGGQYGSPAECFLQSGEKIHGFERLGQISNAYSKGEFRFEEGGGR